MIVSFLYFSRNAASRTIRIITQIPGAVKGFCKIIRTGRKIIVQIAPGVRFRKNFHISIAISG